MAFIGPIFCLVGGVAQGHVLWRFARGLLYLPWWEWTVITLLSGCVGWLLGMALGVRVHTGLTFNYSGTVTPFLANQIVFFIWGAVTGLLVGLAQWLLLSGKLRFALGSHFAKPHWKVGVIWTSISGASWGLGLLLSELLLLVTRRLAVPATTEEGALTLAGIALQIVSMIALGVPTGVATGVALARLLRHAETQAPPRQIIIRAT